MRSERNTTLDLLRGFFLCVIIVDHVYRFPNFFELFTGRGQLWVSAAEGFFLISGLLVGLLKPSFKKLWKRAALLYVLTISLSLLFTLWGHFLPPTNLKAGLWTGNFSSLLINLLLLRYSYGWGDFLPYYSVFLFFSPLAINMLRKWGATPVLLISGVAWVVRGNSFYAAWQLLFVIGVVAGFYLPKLECMLAKYQNPFAILGGLGLLASAIWVFKLDPNNLNLMVKYLFDKDTLGPGRLTLALVVFTALYLLAKRYDQAFKGTIGSFFESLGRNSLVVYVFHAVIVLPLGAMLPYSPNYLLNTLVTFGVLVATRSLARLWLILLKNDRKTSTLTNLTLGSNTALVSLDNLFGNREA